MADWEKDLGDFNKGLADTHESRQPWNKLNQNMQMGRRAAGHDNADAAAAPSKGGSIWSGLAGLLGSAGLIVGLLLGANFLDKGWAGVVIMLGSAALGLVIGAAPILLLQRGIRIIYEKSLWRRQAKDNTADGLVQFWDAKYGAPPLPKLLEAMDGNGSAWIMDGKGNFVLRMKSGKSLFVGHEQDDNGEMKPVVRSEGKGFDIEDANNMMLVERSLGRTSITLLNAGKKNGRLMWAAAKLADIDVDGYRPDRKALQLMNDLKGNPKAGIRSH